MTGGALLLPGRALEPCTPRVARTHGGQCLVQLLRVHSPAAVAVEAGEVLLPAVQHRPELLELREAHGTRHIFLSWGQGSRLCYLTIFFKFSSWDWDKRTSMSFLLNE